MNSTPADVLAAAKGAIAEADPPHGEFGTSLAVLTDRLGMRLDLIRPADSPDTAIVSDGAVSLLVTAPSGGDVVVTIAPDALPALAPTAPAEQTLVVSHPLADDQVIGRAGMRYRDLIPDRLGGAVIASHIEVCDGGPVPDLVHHHDIGFQMIFCVSGWVDVVYEDQGPPFRMEAGDCVLQPPHIRHRVLASSAGAQVVEIGSPASHDTLFDHQLELPTDQVFPDRDFGGQRFVRHIAAAATSRAASSDGWTETETGIADASAGAGSAVVLAADAGAASLAITHDRQVRNLFVLAGAVTLDVDGEQHRLDAMSNAAVPPGRVAALVEPTSGCRILDVGL